jgi:type IV pilus assembly protein PilB
VQINVGGADLRGRAPLDPAFRPDVVMVGEIRDGETAKISIEAALTGHLVLSTLHTNDAPGALTRLNEMGVEPFLTGSAVSAVLAQRLARSSARTAARCTRRRSTSCSRPASRPRSLPCERRHGVLPQASAARAATRPGYRGRIGIFQLIMTMTEELETLAASKAIEELARGHRARGAHRRCRGFAGMRTLWDDGLAKVAAGLTSIEELSRVKATPQREPRAPAFWAAWATRSWSA